MDAEVVITGALRFIWVVTLEVGDLLKVLTDDCQGAVVQLQTIQFTIFIQKRVVWLGISQERDPKNSIRGLN
jgi:hypothetical protein